MICPSSPRSGPTPVVRTGSRGATDQPCSLWSSLTTLAALRAESIDLLFGPGHRRCGKLSRDSRDRQASRAQSLKNSKDATVISTLDRLLHATTPICFGAMGQAWLRVSHWRARSVIRLQRNSTMDRGEAMKLLRGGPERIAKSNQQRRSDEPVPDLQSVQPARGRPAWGRRPRRGPQRGRRPCGRPHHGQLAFGQPLRG